MIVRTIFSFWTFDGILGCATFAAGTGGAVVAFVAFNDILIEADRAFSLLGASVWALVAFATGLVDVIFESVWSGVGTVTVVSALTFARHSVVERVACYVRKDFTRTKVADFAVDTVANAA